MRAITVAIGKQGINFFMQQYLQQTLTAKFRTLPDNRAVYVGPGPQDGPEPRHDSDLSHWFGNYDDGAAKLTVHSTAAARWRTSTRFTAIPARGSATPSR